MQDKTSDTEACTFAQDLLDTEQQDVYHALTQYILKYTISVR